ncbi:hypothetical protein ACPUVO_07500 [Pseudocolwellia sp. HL-MZ19]|uniref:hypothetical protein n=1 Tax=Pseudocolwellia sp. HL-MZ19 TaxID=3400846 RepID=UPI003CEE1934
MPLIIFLYSSLYNTVQAESNESILSYLKVSGVIEDENNYIWFSGQNTLARFDGTDLIHFSNNNEKWNIPYTWIFDVIKDGDDFIVTTNTSEIWRLNPRTAKTIKLNINQDHISTHKTAIYKGNYYFKTTKGEIYVYSQKNKTTKLLVDEIKTSALKNTKNNLYTAGFSGLFKLENDSFTQLLKNKVSSITPINDGVLVVTDALILYLGDDGSRHEIPNTQKHVISTKSNDGHAILLSKEGVISKIAIPSLINITHNYPEIESMIPRDLIQAESNTIWLVSNKGIQKIFPSVVKNHPKIYNVADNANEIEVFNNEVIIGTYGDGIYKAFNNGKNISEKINPSLTLLGKRTMDLLAIDDALYIAAFDGLWVYKKDSNTAKKVDFIDNNQILLKLTKKDHLLYIATDGNGFYIYNLKTQRIIDHISLREGIKNPEIIDILTLDNNNIWLATPDGIEIYNRYTKTNRQLKLSVKNKVISFATHNNKVYAATKGNGIFVLNFHGDVLSQIAEDVSFSMINVIADEVWAPAAQGFYRINTHDDSISLIPNTEKYNFTDAPVILNSKIFVPHHTGLLEIPLTKVAKYNPKIVISQVTVSGNTQLFNDDINVGSENDVVSINLASLDFRPGKDKQFKYQINSGEWQSIYGNQLTLTGLESGIYKLAFKGTNSLGQWSDNVTFTEVNVAYPWYLTPQIKVLYIFSISFIFIAVIWLTYLRYRSIKHIHTILSNNIKSHGKVTFNVERNLLKAKGLLYNLESLPAENLYQVSSIINKCIHSLAQNENEEEPNTNRGKSLEVALPYFVDYIHQKYHSNVQLEIEMSESTLNLEMQADIYKIIYETITSTIMNGSGRNFEISLEEFKHKIWLTITNDENGFSKFKNKVNFDMSMYYIRQIANKHNASFNVFNAENSSSQLVISIPLMSIS